MLKANEVKRLFSFTENWYGLSFYLTEVMVMKSNGITSAGGETTRPAATKTTTLE